MPRDKDDAKKSEKKEPKRELRDLPPKNDVKGGGQRPDRSEKRAPRTTGEIDFMNWD